MNHELLDTSIRYLKGVGEAREKLMLKLGIRTLRDLIAYFPRTYEDRTSFKQISSLTIGETVCVQAMVVTAPQLSHVRKGLDLVKLRAVDETGTLEITFFNQNYIKDAIKSGETYVFYGKVDGIPKRYSMANPLFDKTGDGSLKTGDGSLSWQSQDREPSPVLSPVLPSTGRIMPIYPLTAGLSQKVVAGAVRSGLSKCGDELPDVLPDSLVKQYELCRARYAYENVHFPVDMKALELARKRLIFEELFVLAAAMKLLRAGRGEKTGKSLEMPEWGKFYETLGFGLTNAQKRAITEAAADMNSQRAMSRLIQGDVGSGKTVIAAACCYMAWLSGCQSAFMAPTEILANQHFRVLSALLEPLGMRIGLLTGSMSPKRKREAYEKLSAGETDLVIGTHALISEGVRFKELALVITDEQHRFGVDQRAMLTEKGDSPHVLVMSATPIPRTLALIIYGDLDVSIIDEMPPGRQTIETYVVGERHRERVYTFVEKLVNEGRQVYIICPMVDEGDTTEPSPCVTEGLKSAKEYHEKLQKEVFPNLRVALVHGKMPSKEKDKVMSAFTAGQADILVATTVVEVGVDVPNAALMIVENADRFGLSQLHQLRGRVGRGEHVSYCILFRGAAGETSRERLDVMRTTTDGFKIAEEDLKLRGPGDFFGSRQHGLPEMRIASLATDMVVLSCAQNAADETLRADPALSALENRKLAEQIQRLFNIAGGRLS